MPRSSSRSSLKACDRRMLRRLNDWPYVLLIATTLAWGGNAIAGQLARGHVSPAMLVFLRWLLVAIMLAWLYGRQLPPYWPIIKRNKLYLFCMAAIGLTGFNTLFYIASTMTSGVNIGIIQGSIPITVLVGAFFAFGTVVKPAQAFGAAVTLVGVVIVATAGNPERLFLLDFNPGDAWMTFACLLYGSYTVGLQKRPPIPASVFFMVLSFIALVTSVPMMMWELHSNQAILPDLQGWLITIFVAVFPSLLAQIWFMRGVELIGPGRAGLFVNLVPVFASFLAVLILSEQFHPFHAMALTLVLGGIAIAEFAKRRIN